MSLRRNLAKILVPILVPPRHGVWIEGEAKRDGIYIFLFGRSAESISLTFPDAPSTGPMPVFLTDDSNAERRLIERGHLALNVGAFRVMKEKLGHRYVWFLAQALFAMYRPARVLFTPEFSREMPRSRTTVRRILKYMMDKEFNPLVPRLGFIIPEATVEVRPTEQVIKVLGTDVEHDGMLHYYAFGSPLYFDYEMAFEQKPPADIEWLGWRSEFPAPSKKEALPDFHVMVMDARQEAAIIAGLEALPNRSAWGAIRRVKLADSTFEEALALPGLFICDGRSDLLPLLAAKRPVTLLWDPRADRPTLIRCSYFLGSGRWPVFESVEDLLAALAKKTLRELWMPYENRRCSLEEADGSDVTQRIDRLYIDSDRPVVVQPAAGEP